MPVPVSVLPVRARMVLSLWISSHEASTEGSSDVGLSAAWSESPAGIESETKRAPPIFTKPHRVSVMVIRESLEFSVFAVIAIPPLRPSWPGCALYGFDDGGVGAAAAKMRRQRLFRESVLVLWHGRIGVLCA